MRPLTFNPAANLRLLSIILFLIFNNVAARAQASEEPHTIAPELVGKWCYISRSVTTIENISSSCITLNADGTYEMELDKNAMTEGAVMPELQRSEDTGTWWVSGNVLHYDSYSQGKGSVRFQKANHPRIENTPVLIVQGVIFCTASPRDPW